MTSTTKTCLACHRAIKGRTDKKFCDDTCRNNYNNRLNSDASPLVRTINNALRKNRRILVQLLEEKTEFIVKDKLAARGFRFLYCTHTYTNAKGEVYYYCYDYGYKLVKENTIQVVKAIAALAE
jgi:hypothetical protein